MNLQEEFPEVSQGLFGVMRATRKNKILKTGKRRLRDMLFCCNLMVCVFWGSIFYLFCKVEMSYRVTEVEQGETEYIKLYVTNLWSNSNRVNLYFYLCDVCQRKEKEVKTD